MTLVVFPSKPVGETSAYTFNFSDRLQFGESITGAVVAAAVASGVDPNPSAIISGMATYNATTVTQNITGGLPGVIYAIACTVTASGSHNYVKQGSLAVLNDVGNYVTP
jgi:hypothetical protein